MTEWIPCPACGTEHAPEVAACEVCGFPLTAVPPRGASAKCARCGQPIGEGFEFCQVCGLRVQARLPRPITQNLKLIPRRPPESPAEGPGSADPGPRPAGQEMATLASPAAPAAPRMASPEPGAGSAGPRMASLEPGPGTGGPRMASLEPEPPKSASAPPAAAPAVEGSPPPAGRAEEGSWGQARVILAPNAAPAEEPPRETPGPGDTVRMGRKAVLQEPASVQAPVNPAPPGPSWSAPMARLAVESSRRPAGAAPLRIVLVQRDGSEGESLALRGSVTIGRRDGELVFPGDEFLSPAHARLEPAPGGGARLSDLGSRNGVYVRISRPEPVFPGDLFLIGHHLLRLENVPPGGRGQEVDGEGTRAFGTPMAPAWGRLTLIGVDGAEAEVHCLRQPQIVFGRELGDIVFPTDPFVSWQHAQLTMELRGDAMSVLLTDLRSANGTYLRIRGDVILQPGDMFRVGDQIFRVRMH